MAVSVNLHLTHRQFTGGQETVQVEGNTVGECLRHLTERFPPLADALFDGDGNLQRHIEVYLNLESTYPEELAKPTEDGDEIHITVMLAGG